MSTVLVTILSIDRCVAIRHPFLYRRIQSKKQASGTIAGMAVFVSAVGWQCFGGLQAIEEEDTANEPYEHHCRGKQDLIDIYHFLWYPSIDLITFWIVPSMVLFVCNFAIIKTIRSALPKKMKPKKFHGTALKAGCATGIEVQVAPGIGENFTPGIGENVTPRIEENVAPGVEEQVAPGFDENVAPGIEEQVELGIEEQVAPGIEENVMPGIEENVMPGIEEKVEPGIEEQVAPGIEEHVAPGIEEQVELGIEEQVTPGIEEQVAPGIEEQVALGIEEQVAPGIEEQVAPGIEEPVKSRAGDITNQTNVAFQKHGKRLTRISIILSISYCILVSPWLILRVILLSIQIFGESISLSDETRSAVQNILLVIYLTNYSLNFWLYCFCTPSFREDLKEMLCGDICSTRCQLERESKKERCS